MNDETKSSEAKPWRKNIIAITLFLAAIAVSAAVGSVFAANEVIASGLMNLALISTTGVVGFGSNIIKLDESPFDSIRAEFEIRLVQIQSDANRTIAACNAENSRAMRQMELDHEYRNGQNDAVKALIGKVAK